MPMAVGVGPGMGFYATADLGQLDHDGYLWFSGGLGKMERSTATTPLGRGVRRDDPRRF